VAEITAQGLRSGEKALVLANSRAARRIGSGLGT